MNYLKYSILFISLIIVSCSDDVDSKYDSIQQLGFSSSAPLEIALKQNEIMIDIVDNYNSRSEPFSYFEAAVRQEEPNLSKNYIDGLYENVANKVDIQQYVGELFTEDVVPYYNKVTELLLANKNLAILHPQLNTLLEEVNSNLNNNDLFLMQTVIHTAIQSTLLWNSESNGGLGYHDKFQEKILQYPNLQTVASTRSSGADIAFGAVAGVTGAVVKLGGAMVLGAVPGTNAVILGGLAFGGLWGATVAALGCLT